MMFAMSLPLSEPQFTYLRSGANITPFLGSVDGVCAYIGWWMVADELIFLITSRCSGGHRGLGSRAPG